MKIRAGERVTFNNLDKEPHRPVIDPSLKDRQLYSSQYDLQSGMKTSFIFNEPGELVYYDYFERNDQLRLIVQTRDAKDDNLITASDNPEINGQLDFDSSNATPYDSKGRVIGYLDSVSEGGLIRGWAIDTSKPDEDIKIELYFNNPKDTPGTQLFFETFANLPRLDVVSKTGYEGNHGFQVLIPSILGDRSKHTLYVYAVIGDQSWELKGSKKSFSFFVPSPAIINIISPNSGETIVGDELVIEYSVSGNLSGIANPHAHWSIDGDYSVHDTEFTGKFIMDIRNLSPGEHLLEGSLARGHHEKIINSEVFVKFTKNDE